ncbi:MAG: type II toxin-antitoxin system RelE/ParE family toxin [Candidatus Sungbacteria bacterium]|nr:type II toxin-antitoxin system RelE/ParE family toxin [Candidatus Sungbacteria bacterium]
MLIQPLNDRVNTQLNKFQLNKKFDKQLMLFSVNPLHPSLHTEKLEPKHVGLYSFRIDKKYRAIFRIRKGQAEIVHITKHYQK